MRTVRTAECGGEGGAFTSSCGRRARAVEVAERAAGTNRVCFGGGGRCGYDAEADGATAVPGRVQDLKVPCLADVDLLVLLEWLQQ